MHNVVPTFFHLLETLWNDLILNQNIVLALAYYCCVTTDVRVRNQQISVVVVAVGMTGMTLNFLTTPIVFDRHEYLLLSPTPLTLKSISLHYNSILWPVYSAR